MGSIEIEIEIERMGRVETRAMDVLRRKPTLKTDRAKTSIREGQ